MVPAIYYLNCSVDLCEDLQKKGHDMRPISKLDQGPKTAAVFLIETSTSELNALQGWHAQVPDALLIAILSDCIFETALAASRRYLGLTVLPGDIDGQDVHSLIMEHPSKPSTAQLQHHLQRYPYLAGDSAALKVVLDLAAKRAMTLEDLLLVGEAGSGRSQLAHLIHDLSPLRNYPFLEIDCMDFFASGGNESQFYALLNPLTAESAENWSGTLSLKRCDEINPALWQSLIHTLAARWNNTAIPRLGSVRIIISIRPISLAQVPEATLKTRCIKLPTLCERLSFDLPVLLSLYQKQRGIPVQLSALAHLLMLRYTWPGQVQELWEMLDEIRSRVTASTVIEAWQLPFSKASWEQLFIKLMDLNVMDWQSVAGLHAHILLNGFDHSTNDACQSAGLSSGQFSAIIKAL